MFEDLSLEQLESLDWAFVAMFDRYGFDDVSRDLYVTINKRIALYKPNHDWIGKDE